MKLIVGLGNPGEKYEHTRHNLGFVAVDRLLKDSVSVEQSKWSSSDKFKSDIASFEWQRRTPVKTKDSVLIEKILLAKPLTYMNNSGLAVGLMREYYKLDTSDVWVIHDEIDLPLGTLKIRFGGGSAGHKGIESIMKRFNSEKFWRFRLGIGTSRNREEVGGRAMGDVDDYVLGLFGQGQSGKVRELLKRCSKSIMTGLDEGLEPAMNKFNTK